MGLHQSQRKLHHLIDFDASEFIALSRCCAIRSSSIIGKGSIGHPFVRMAGLLLSNAVVHGYFERTFTKQMSRESLDVVPT